MHYTASHTVNIDPEDVFRRLIVDSTGGMYCFGQNMLLMGMLRRLGYRVYPGSGRVLVHSSSWPNIPLPSLTHMVLFVQPFEGSNLTYLVDVGFSGAGLCRPLLLSDHPDNQAQGATASEKHRLVKSALPMSALPMAAQWELQLYRPSHPIEAPWLTVYTFNENENHPIDFFGANFGVCHGPGNVGTTLRSFVLCCKHFFIDENDKLEGDLGKYILFGTELRRSVGKESKVIQTFGKGEEQKRIQALEEYFGITIGENGENHILETPAHL